MSYFPFPPTRRFSPPFLPRNPLRALARGLRAVLHSATPLLAQVVVTSRCNLRCAYCDEYSDAAPRIPLPVLEQRIHHLSDLGTVIVTLTGGEPLLRQDLDQLVRIVVSAGMVCTLVSNGHLLTRTRIERLNDAGLTLLQLSIDGTRDTPESGKSLQAVSPELDLLQSYARFAVNVNAVFGVCPPEELEALARVVSERGFYMTLGLRHDERGGLSDGLSGPESLERYRALSRLCRRSGFHRPGEGWESRLLLRGESPWTCKAGARYLYVDENGSVSYCSRRRGTPGIDLLHYGQAEIAEALAAPKGCEATCTLSCVRRASAIDAWRPRRGGTA